MLKCFKNYEVASDTPIYIYVGVWVCRYVRVSVCEDVRMRLGSRPSRQAAKAQPCLKIDKQRTLMVTKIKGNPPQAKTAVKGVELGVILVALAVAQSVPLDTNLCTRTVSPSAFLFYFRFIYLMCALELTTLAAIAGSHLWRLMLVK